MEQSKGTILIAGCGYRGQRLAALLLRQGYKIKGITRSAAHAAQLVVLGVEPVIADITRPETLTGIGREICAVYHLMGSMNGSEEQHQRLHVDGTRNLLAALGQTKLHRYVYESSTAVYGQIDGEWIDEQSPRAPSSLMGKLRVQAEDLLLHAFRQNVLPLVILRPSSIYRPEGAINKKISAGTYTLTSDPEKLMNHIYIDDFLEIMTLALNRGQPGEAYNVTDDEPKRGIDYVNCIADLMQKPCPKVEWAAADNACADLIRSSNKRCSNAKLKRDFNLRLRYPTYREGLRESARQGWRETL